MENHNMNLENQKRYFETQLIEDIDTNGYLFHHHNPLYECKERNYEHVDLGCDKDVVRKDNICEETNDYDVNIGCDDDEVNDDGIWEKPNEDRVNIGCDDDEVIGKIFYTPDDVYTFYNQYAFMHEFVMKHRSHNKFHRSMACKSLIVELGKSGLRPCQVRKAVNAMKSPNEPTITSKQCANS
ncbi:hypothetical protein Tco_0568319 [Tanacetum coccineum]